jgi:hypothetical protein
VRVLLVEPDYYARYPPLGLLKLATYHRLKGDTVYFVRGVREDLPQPDLIYVTSLFTYAWRPVHDAVRFYKRRFPNAPTHLGGIYATLLPEHAALSGADEVHRGLLNEVEMVLPSWDLVPEWDGSILFASRGCIRKCGFCSVPKLEGPPDAFKDKISRFVYPGHSKVILWDNNILGNSNWEPIVDELMDIGLEVDFNQGLDARLITDKMAEKLAKLKTHSIRMAYDYPGIGPALPKAVEKLSAAGIDPRRIVVYTLYNYIDTPEDFHRRVSELLSLGVASYPMRFEPLTSLQKNDWLSPHWTREQLQQVAAARRVMGFSGAFPPYAALANKIQNARDFEDAFSIRERGGSPKRPPREKTQRYAGPMDWLSYIRKAHAS